MLVAGTGERRNSGSYRNSSESFLKLFRYVENNKTEFKSLLRGASPVYSLVLSTVCPDCPGSDSRGGDVGGW